MSMAAPCFLRTSTDEVSGSKSQWVFGGGSVESRVPAAGRYWRVRRVDPAEANEHNHHRPTTPLVQADDSCHVSADWRASWRSPCRSDAFISPLTRSKSSEMAAKLSRRVVDLTRSSVLLHVQLDGQEERLTALRNAYVEERRQILNDAENQVKDQRGQAIHLRGRGARLVSALDKQHTRFGEDAILAIAKFRQDADDMNVVVTRHVEQLQGNLLKAVQESGGQVERLHFTLAQVSSKVQMDERSRVRQMNAEAGQERSTRDGEFEAELSRLRLEHETEMEDVRVAHKASVQSLLQVHDSELIENELRHAALIREEMSLEQEQRRLEVDQNELRQALAEATATAASARDSLLERQRLRQHFKQQMQEKQDRLAALTKEAEIALDRQSKAKKDILMFTEKIATYRLADGAKIPRGTNTPNVRHAQGRLEGLRGAQNYAHQCLKDQRSLLLERRSLSKLLGQELVEIDRKSVV